jgi:FkbM family methyltransferase
MIFLSKLIYNNTINRIIRPFAYFFNSVFGVKTISISGIIRLKLNNIKFKLATNQTSFVTQELYYNKAENYEFTKLFVDLIQKSDVFFDIGANIGYFSIIASKLNPNAKIFACEPSLGSLHYIKENIKINLCDNVTIIDKAISNVNGKLLFHEITNSKYPWIKHNLNGSNSLDESNISHEYQSYEVDVVTIQKILEENKLEKLDLIKLDTECTEHLILSSSINEINQYKPIIISEVYEVIQDLVENIIVNEIYDYTIFQYIQETNKLKKIKSFTELEEKDENRNFVFCPQDKLVLIDKFIF